MSTTMKKKLGDWGEVLLRDPCAYCGADADVLDHIVSRTSGGKEVWENATASCAFCNGSKGRRSLLGWLGYQISGIADEVEFLNYQRALWMGVGR